MHLGKEYSEQIINVTFKFSYKQFNQVYLHNETYYIRAGYSFQDLVFGDNGLAYDDNGTTIIGVNTTQKLTNGHLSSEEFTDNGDPFRYNDETQQYELIPSRNETLLTREELRNDLYTNGFYCDGNKYVRFKRSSGSSRIGKCLFIESTLAHRMSIWERCGLNIRKGQKIDLAAWEAYVSLTTSSIIDTIELRPENILLIDDYDSQFEDRVLAVGLKGTWLDAEPKTTTIKNCIWDGQSLLDTSVFGDKYADRGMLLLRTRFFKSACFHANIQQFFQDMGITDVSQLNGKTRAKKIEDIKLITTPSSLKYLKFGEWDQWLDKLEPTFGIVKYDKPSHYFDGRMVQCHYQLLNTLHMSYEETEELLAPSKHYFDMLDTNPAVFRYHVRCKGDSLPYDFKEFESINNICYYFLGVNNKFIDTEVFKQWKADMLRAYRDNIKKGHVLIHGTYATLLSNPYEMLLQSIGRFDGTSNLGKGNISCSMFGENEVLLGTRSPHVAAGNILLANNVKSPMIQRYFNLSPYIVCINTIEENILERLSGADMDSDTMLLTSEPLLVAKAKEHYSDFLVPTKLVPAQMKKRHYTNADKADLDHTTANNRIGEIVNLSQELNSLFWDEMNSKGKTFDEIADIYNDIAKLDVLSNIEIDRAKRECVVDSVKEMQRIREKYNVTGEDGKKVKPAFFAFLARKKGYYNPDKYDYRHHETTMDHVYTIVNKWRAKKRSPKDLLPITAIFDLDSKWIHEKRKRDAVVVLEGMRTLRTKVRDLWCKYSNADPSDRDQRKSYIERINDISETNIGYLQDMELHTKTIYWIMHLIETPEYSDVRQQTLKSFFGHEIKNFRRFLRETEQTVPLIEECENGDIDLYGFRFGVRN